MGFKTQGSSYAHACSFETQGDTSEFNEVSVLLDNDEFKVWLEKNNTSLRVGILGKMTGFKVHIDNGQSFAFTGAESYSRIIGNFSTGSVFVRIIAGKEESGEAVYITASSTTSYSSQYGKNIIAYHVSVER